MEQKGKKAVKIMAAVLCTIFAILNSFGFTKFLDS